MAITSEQYRTSLQNVQSRYIRLELLNYQFQTVDSLEGVATSGSITIDANADIRRTGSIAMVVSNSTFEVGSGNKIWLDKYIRVYVGINNLRINAIASRVVQANIVSTYEMLPSLTTETVRVGTCAEVVADMNYDNNTTYYQCTSTTEGDIDWKYVGQTTEWTSCGIYIIDAPSYNYNLSNNTLSLSLLDMMAKLTGIRNGYLPGIPVKLSAGENIRQAIIDTLALGGFTQYVVEEATEPGTIPNDLEFSQGATVYSLLSGLRDIYPDYEIFFGTDNTFYYKPIPTGENESVVANDELFNKIVLTEQLDTDFQNVKNSIEVYGRTHNPAAYSTLTNVAGNAITLTIASVASYTTDLIYGFSLVDNTGINSPFLKINNLTSYPVLNDGGVGATIQAETGSVFYCVQFKGTYWRWLGHLQAYGFAEDTNPESPFYVEGTVGRIKLPLYDGEYANCFTDVLAQTRAEYELWMHCNMNNTLSLTCVPCYWMDVNTLISYTLKRNGVLGKYIIKSITFGLEPTATMAINAILYYPNYPNITGNSENEEGS